MSTDYTRFRRDNTQGYADAQLAEMNRRFTAEVERRRRAGDLPIAPDLAARKAVLDHVAERVQADYDTEISGEVARRTYRITSKAGAVMGEYAGETPEGAFRAMVADGGGEYGSESVGTEEDWIIEPVSKP